MMSTDTFLLFLIKTKERHAFYTNCLTYISLLSRLYFSCLLLFQYCLPQLTEFQPSPSWWQDWPPWIHWSAIHDGVFPIFFQYLKLVIQNLHHFYLFLNIDFNNILSYHTSLFITVFSDISNEHSKTCQRSSSSRHFGASRVRLLYAFGKLTLKRQYL